MFKTKNCKQNINKDAERFDVSLLSLAWERRVWFGCRLVSLLIILNLLAVRLVHLLNHLQVYYYSIVGATY